MFDQTQWRKETQVLANSDSMAHTPSSFDQQSLGSASTSAVRQYLRTAQDYGIQPAQALSAVNIPTGVIDNSVPRISGRQFQNLIRYLIDATQDPLFGLNSARYVQPGSYSLLGYIVMNCRTSREALYKTPEYEAIVGDMGVTRIEPSDEHLAMSWICQYDDPVVRPHMIDNVLGSWLVFARWLTDLPEGKPTQVLFEHPIPDDEQLKQYQTIFATELIFGADRNALILQDAVLDIPLRQPDTVLLQTLEQQAASLIEESLQEAPIVIQTRNVIRQLLTQGIPRREKVAEQLEVNERTLQRRLQDAGTSYQQLLDTTRCDMACQWLAQSHMPVSDIASRLGFSEATSFHRRFKIWTGATPGQYRQNHIFSEH